MARTLLTADPRPHGTRYRWSGADWPAKWVGHADAPGGVPTLLAFRRRFRVDAETIARLHVTADERYALYLDGNLVGRGSERGDIANWFYETYDEPLSPGEHTLVARVWWLGHAGPVAQQMSSQPAFLLWCEGALESELSTGIADWETKIIDGYSFRETTARGYVAVGVRTNIDGRKYPWGVERGEGDGWTPVVVESPAFLAIAAGESRARRLRHALLPAMSGAFSVSPSVRNVQVLKSFDEDAVVGEETFAADASLDGTVWPPRAIHRIVIDCNNYACAYTTLTTTGGRGARISVRWAESLLPADDREHKRNRDEIAGRVFEGIGGEYWLDGGAARTYSPPWWDAGRYIELRIETANEAVTIDRFALEPTGYPFAFESSFESSDARLAKIIPPALHTLKMCGHETYMDCPYYEQLMYIGDTRLEALVTYVTARDARLPRKAIELFDLSREPSGWTSSRYPTRVFQRIPTFSMWWVGMVHDYLMWRGDDDFVRDRMAGVRAVCEAIAGQVNAEGLVVSPDGWNFVDWTGWKGGIPPGGEPGEVGALVNLHAAIALRTAAKLESHFCATSLLAQRYTQIADRMIRASLATFYDLLDGYADDSQWSSFSEHTQALAVIEGSLEPAVRKQLLSVFLSAQWMKPATIYFSHYVFEALRLLGRADCIFDRMGLWFDLDKFGLKTTPEMPEPSRSDCHAWGAHPVFHFYATIAGIRPTAAGMSRVEIRPQPGTLTSFRAKMIHPAGGFVEVSLCEGRYTASVPAGVSGELVVGGKQVDLIAGETVTIEA